MFMSSRRCGWVELGGIGVELSMQLSQNPPGRAGACAVSSHVRWSWFVCNLRMQRGTNDSMMACMVRPDDVHCLRGWLYVELLTWRWLFITVQHDKGRLECQGQRAWISSMYSLHSSQTRWRHGQVGPVYLAKHHSRLRASRVGVITPAASTPCAHMTCSRHCGMYCIQAGLKRLLWHALHASM